MQSGIDRIDQRENVGLSNAMFETGLRKVTGISADPYIEIGNGLTAGLAIRLVDFVLLAFLRRYGGGGLPRLGRAPTGRHRKAGDVEPWE